MKINVFEGEEVKFLETTDVVLGVTCDVYLFKNDDKKDLGIVRVSKSCKTPMQKVLSGEKTLEIFLSGSGTLNVVRRNGSKEVFKFPENTQNRVLVNIDDVMQWQAGADSDLVFAEVCYPPYFDGRFEVLEI